MCNNSSTRIEPQILLLHILHSDGVLYLHAVARQAVRSTCVAIMSNTVTALLRVESSGFLPNGTRCPSRAKETFENNIYDIHFKCIMVFYKQLQM